MGRGLATIVVQLVEGERPTRIRLGVLGRNTTRSGPAYEGHHPRLLVDAYHAESGRPRAQPVSAFLGSLATAMAVTLLSNPST